MRSRLVQVLDVGESPQSRLVCGVEGEYAIAESLIFATALLVLPSPGWFEGVEGAPEEVEVA
jgi:hypothetical protein